MRMVVSEESDEKSVWSGSVQSSNGSHDTDGAYTVSLLAGARDERTKHVADPPPHLTPQSAAQPSKPTHHSVPAVHRPFLFLLCVVSFFVTFRPSEPFLTPYLIDDKGLGADTVNERVYPTWTYCYFAFLLPAGMLGEVVGYRVMIVCQLIALLGTYVILIWAEGVRWMQFMQATFGFASAVQSCVFFTYIYRCAPVEIYPTVVSSVRVTQRSGQWLQHEPHIAGVETGSSMLGALAGQVLVWTHHPLWQLFVPTLTAVTVALTAFLFLPSQQSQQQLIDTETNGKSTILVDSAASIHAPPLAPSVAPSLLYSSLRSVVSGNFTPLSQLWSLLASQYRNSTVRTFSVYLMLGYSVQELVLNYDTTLFYVIAPAASSNGVVVGAGWLIGALAAYLVSFHSVVQAVSRHPHVTLSVLPLIAGCLLLWSSAAQSVELAYTLFVAFYGIMAFLVCISSALIASHMSVGTFAFLFSVNTFGSLLVQTLVQLIIGEHVLLLDIRDKYRAFAAQLFFVAVLFAAVGVTGRMTRATLQRST